MSRPTLRFARHYAEMLIAMMVGMLVLGMPFGLVTDGPALTLLGMGVSMTIPMVAWMRYRGHGWRASNEMAAAMLVPTFAAMVVHGAGIVDDFDTVMFGEHVVMLAAMLVAMLLRPEEYLHHQHGGAVTAEA